MNTKNKIIAILMASIVAMAVGVPMAFGSEAETSATVGNAAPTVVAVTVTPDSVTMSPCPDNTPITVTAEVSDDNGVPDDIAFVNITASNASTHIVESLPVTMPYNASSGKYEATLNLKCCTPVGAYNVTVEAKDKADETDSKDGEFTVAGTKALSINFDKVSFTGAPGSKDNDGTANITTGETDANVTSQGNAVIDIGVNATDLTSATTGQSIDGTNMNATIGGIGPAVVKPKNTFDTSTVCKEDESATFTLSIPAAILPASDYQGTLTISAE